MQKPKPRRSAQKDSQPTSSPDALHNASAGVRQCRVADALGIVGPTGIGKTEVAVALARRLPGEIVVVDSMQVYRGMEIGTGKPDARLRREVPHHGLDLVEPEEEFSAAQYVKAVSPAIASIRARGLVPVLVGGSGLYFKALVDGLCKAPPKNATLREKLSEQTQTEGAEALHRNLSEVDPVSAGRIHPNDARRIIRALEVFSETGRALSDWQARGSPLSGGLETFRWVGLTCGREKLYQKIEGRIMGWFASGWLEEARHLHARPLSRTAREALGYKELFHFLESRRSWEETARLIIRNTRRYAKRQWAWFRANRRIQWIDVEDKKPEETAERIFQNLKGSDPFQRV